MKLIIIDNRVDFCQDIKTYISIDDDLSINPIIYTDYNNIEERVKKYNPDAVVVADNVVNGADFTMPPCPIYGYSSQENVNNVFTEYGITYLGYFRKSVGLIKYLEGMSVQNSASMPIQNPAPVQQVPVAPIQKPVAVPATNQVFTPTPIPVQQAQPVYQQPVPQPMYQNPVIQPVQQMRPIPNQQFVQPMPIQNSQQYQQLAPEEQFPVQQHQINYSAPLNQGSYSNMKSEQQTQMYGKLVQDDLYGNTPNKPKVATIYSAKGGVGKTTIAAELAVYLSLTCKGRGKARVCLLDYNIDFGDIRTTLNFEHTDKNMSFWAAEIKERITNGEKAESINYTKKEIEEFLAKKDYATDTEFYTLLAPPKHLDSMDIEEAELSVMLKNIINNGDFDYVICDTGNNTRDSAILALDSADYVFMIVTQDVTTNNCNDSFIDTMRLMNFDENKIKLIINDIVPARETGVSVSDIEKHLKYQCIARFKHNNDVIRANNNGNPLVFISNHEFTKELRKVVSFLTGESDNEDIPKKSLFSKLFKK